ncbi:hypothetical protein ABZP36_034331 [Zizania latifolia]
MFDRFLEHVIDEHNERRRQEGASFVANDVVDVLLQIADDPNLEVKLKREGVKVFTQDLIAGGTESSAMTVEWAISELLKKPEVLAKATEELDRVIGRGRWVMEKDITSLPYIDTIGGALADAMLVPRGRDGRRMCLGYSLGLKVIQVSLANLLHGFAWSLPDGVTKEQLSMEEIFGLLTLRKFPLDAIVEPKLPARLYSTA